MSFFLLLSGRDVIFFFSNRKQKAKEAEEIENAKQREQNTIKKVLNEIITKVEAEEQAGKTRTIEMIKEMLDEMISDAVVFSSLKETIIQETVKNIFTKEVSLEDAETKMDVEICKKEPEVSKSEKQGEPELIVLDSDSEQVADDKIADDVFDHIPKEVDVIEILDETKAKPDYCAFGFASGANIPPNVPVEVTGFPPQIAPFEPYPHEQLMEDNYYLTLDDLKNIKKVNPSL